MRARQWAGWLLLAVGLLAAAGTLLPVPPRVLDTDLDNAFGATLHYFATHDYAVGSGHISTFGPLGFVFYAIYFPASFAWLFVLRAMLATATVSALAWLGFGAQRSLWGAGIALLTCVPFLAPPDVWFLTLPLLAVFVEQPGERTAPTGLRIALGAAIGLTVLIKFTSLLATLVVLGPPTIAALLRRRVPQLPIAALVTAGIVWPATGHTLADALLYVDWSWREISAGYGTAMQLPTDPFLVWHAVGVSVAVMAAGVLFVRRRLRSGRSMAGMALAATLLLLFKAGFVRADVHVFIPVFGLMIVAVLLVLQWARRPVEFVLGALLAAALPGGLWAHAVAVAGQPLLYFPPVFAPEALLRLSTVRVFFTGEMTRMHAWQMAQIREENPLPPLEGPVDVYPYGQAIVLAHEFDFSPRPVFQSYMAYSARLARANADHLLGEHAPEWLIFRVAPIDRRLPSLDDAASWPLFLARYRYVGPAGAFALLQRREVPETWQLDALTRVETTTGREVVVPASGAGPIWAHVDLQETGRDALVGALLSAPVCMIRLARRDGLVRTFRLVPALARAGFLLSPAVESTDDFVRLVGSGSNREHANDVVKLVVGMVDTPGIDSAPRALTVDFLRLRFSH